MLFFVWISFLTCCIAQPHKHLRWPGPRVGSMRSVSSSTATQWLHETERLALADGRKRRGDLNDVYTAGPWKMAYIVKEDPEFCKDGTQHRSQH